MSITLRNTKGSALTHSELDANFSDLSSRMGWVDYNDQETSNNAIDLTAADTYYNLTNDGEGPYTNKNFKIASHGEIWNTANNEFDWSSLNLGDTVDIRIDVSVTTDAPNRSISTDIDLAIGSGGDYTLHIDDRSFKNAGTYQIVRFVSLYMGDTNTLNYPSKIKMSSDGTGDSVVVNGWYVRTHIWGN